MMFIEERHEQILERLMSEGRVTVKELSQFFSVTEDCVRKDLKALEKEGRLKRTYGGAVMSTDYPLMRDVIDRREINGEKKEDIARTALERIRENETIFLDISTTNILLARLLVQWEKRLVVVSNMIDILQVLSASREITAIGAGGTMVRTVNGFLGAETIEFISRYSFDRAFVGTCGLDFTDSAVTTLGAEDGLTKKAVLKSSRHSYLVMENDKFYFNDSYKFAHFDEIDGIITNRLPDASSVQALENAGVTLYVP
jgi:DeoR/GlpR family transcriptional regulator of sugar metabolism